MKTKILILFVFCLFSISGFAQINSKKIKYQPHAFGIETGHGIGVRDKRYFYEPGSFAYSFDTGLRYTWNFSPHVGWDVVKLKASMTDGSFPYIGGHEGFLQIDFDLLTGIRASTPRFGRQKTAYCYGAFRLGGAYYLDTFELKGNEFENEYIGVKFGYTHELEFGIHFKYMFFGPKYSYLNMRHFFGINLGVDIGRYAERNR